MCVHFSLCSYFANYYFISVRKSLKTEDKPPLVGTPPLSPLPLSPLSFFPSPDSSSSPTPPPLFFLLFSLSLLFLSPSQSPLYPFFPLFPMTAFDKRDGLTPEEEEQKIIAKRKMLGNIKFVGK